MAEDPNSEPQYGERVPYVIARGPPNSRLVDRAVDPLEFLNDRSLPHRPNLNRNANHLLSQLHLDANYYISKVLIPPLERIFNLIGADVRKWFVEMPKLRHLDGPASPTKAKDIVETPNPLNIDEHFRSSQCLICGEPGSQGNFHRGVREPFS
jgi:DNA polymerase zeta